MRDLLARIAGRAVERPTPVIFAAVLLTLIGAVAALRLQADRSPDSLVDRGSGTYAATQRFYDEFGDEPVEVLVKGDLDQLLRHRQPRAPAGAGELPLRQGARRGGGQRRARAARLCGHLPPRPERGRLRPGDLPRPVRDSGEQAAQPAAAGGDRAGAARRRSRRRPRRRRPGSPPPSSSRPRLAAFQEVLLRFCEQAPGPRRRVRPDRPAAARRPELRLVGDLRQPVLPAACRRPGSRRSSPAPTRR